MAAADARRGEALLRLGEVAGLAGADREAPGAFDAALAWFEGRGDRASAGRAARRLAEAWARQEEHARARAAYARALALLEPDGGAEPALALVGLATLLAVSLHEQAAGVEHARRALALGERLGEARVVAP